MDRRPYTEVEKMILVELVKDNIEIIENKKTDGTTWMEKHKCWEKISTAFNSQPDVSNKRDGKQLKKCWDNIKQKKRKQNTAEKQHMLQTGGGPLMKMPKQNELMEIVQNIVPHLDVEVASPWDSNATYSKQNEMIPEVPVEESEPKKIVPSKTSTTLNLLSTVYENSSPSTSRTEMNLQKSSTHETEHFTTPSKGRKGSTFLDEEKKLRLQKLQEAIQQQRELHKVKLEMAKIELQNASELHEFKLETARAKAELEKELHEAKLEAALLDVEIKKAMLHNNK